ncbi:MAG: hypothetical protein MJE68_18640 [Proteobacteria bacterium]|nr:hypothetical protein [Pseudomonadota bacterium]
MVVSIDKIIAGLSRQRKARLDARVEKYLAEKRDAAVRRSGGRVRVRGGGGAATPARAVMRARGMGK